MQCVANQHNTHKYKPPKPKRHFQKIYHFVIYLVVLTPKCNFFPLTFVYSYGNATALNWSVKHFKWVQLNWIECLFNEIYSHIFKERWMHGNSWIWDGSSNVFDEWDVCEEAHKWIQLRRKPESLTCYRSKTFNKFHENGSCFSLERWMVNKEIYSMFNSLNKPP